MRLVCLLALSTSLLALIGVRAEDAAVTKRFGELLAREWEYTLSENPTFASYLGDKRYNDRWPDVSPAAIQRQHEHQRRILGELDEINSGDLPSTDRLNYQLYRREIAERIESYPFHWHLVPLDHRGGIQTENEMADALIFKTVKDYEDWIARLRAFPAYMEQTIELMRAGFKQRIVQPKIVMRRVPDQIKKQIVDDPAASLYYRPFNSIAKEIAAGEQ